MAFSISKLCTPAGIYFWISIISLLGLAFMKFQLLSIGVKFIFVLLWTYFLNYLCSKGYSGISWFLVLLPLIAFASMIILTLDAVSISKKQQQKEQFSPGQQQQQTRPKSQFEQAY